MDQRSGDGDSTLGRRLERHRPRLRARADGLVGPGLRPRVDPSDLVQETFLRASREFPRFEGAGDRALLAWLLKILANHLTDQVKHHRRLSRRHDRQGSLDALLERPGSDVRRALTDPGPSPSEGAARREQAVLLADAVERLPEDYREVYRLRTLHHLPFEVVTARMGRSSGAVRMLWARPRTPLRRAGGPGVTRAARTETVPIPVGDDSELGRALDACLVVASPDGRTLATSAEGGCVEIRDVEGGGRAAATSARRSRARRPSSWDGRTSR